MIKRTIQTIARFALVVAVLSGLLPLPVSTSVVQASQPEPVRQANPFQSEYAVDHVLVKLRTAALVTPQMLSRGITGNTELDQTLAQAGGRSLKPLFAASQSVVKDRSGLGRIYRADLNVGQNVEDTLALLAADPNVEYAEPDYIAQKITAPNDPQYPTQWGLAKIQVEGAWAQTNGSPNVIIAVVDSGIDLTHEDLVDNLWVNPGEIPGNGIDDDNNGFIDDVQGWNFIAGSNDLWDENGHGTLVAGIAAARTGNSKGIAGVCGLCKIMPVRVMQTSGSANYSDIAAGINYAVVKGAKVINLSLGGYANSKTLQDAVNNAVAQNIVVVAGSGNDNLSTPFYPSAYDGVISVAATDSADHKASFSNYGAWVKVSAPGVDVLTTALGGDYVLSSGTSQAGPFVAGLAGLLVTLHPAWTPAMVLGQLTHTVDGIDGLNTGFEGKLGVGRINATKALQPAYPILLYSGYSANGTQNGTPDFNADASLTVSLNNDWADALGVSAVLSTTDPLVSVTTGTADFGDILSGQTKANSAPYAIHIATAAGYNHAIPFTLAVTANGGAYTKTLTFTVTTRSSVEEVSGTIAGDTIWTNDKAYNITANVGIAPGVTLTIQPGTVVKFMGNYNLNVGGTLIADGSSGQSIQFVGNNGVSWGRIFFDDPSTDAVTDTNGVYQSGSILRWVEMKGAGQGITCNNATPYINQTETDSGGISCSPGDTVFFLEDSTISGDVIISNSPTAVTGGWHTLNTMPFPQEQFGAAAAPNGKIYTMGGFNGAWGYSIVDEFDPSLNSWQYKTPMPSSRFGLGVVSASNGKIYAIGGVGKGYLSTVEEYDPDKDTWQQKSPLPYAAYNIGVIAVNYKIYAIGGFYAGNIPYVTEYDLTADTWTARAPIPTPRSNLGVATVNGKIYAIGGDAGGSNPLSTVEEFDPITNAWRSRANMPTPRFGLKAVEINGKIYAIGGYPSSQVEEYDPITDKWKQFGSMPISMPDFGLALSTNGRMYAFSNSATLEFTPPTDDIGVHIYSTNISGNLSIPAYSEAAFNTVSQNITLGASSVGKGNHSNSIIFNGSGEASENVLNGGIIAQENMIIRNNFLLGGIQAVAPVEINGNDIQNAPGWAIQVIGGSGVVTITGNRLVGNANGIYATTGKIEGNLVANISGDGLRAGAATIQNNTFTGIQGNGVYLNGIPVKLEGNNFEFNTGTYDLYNDNPAGQYTLAPNNWWGTTTTATIRSRIFDFNIDYTKGRVTFSPILTGPSQTAPAYVRSLTLDPPSPVGIQTVNFTVEFSRPMDVTRNPQIAFGPPVTDIWTTKASMPTARAFLGVAAASNGKIYAIGGENGSVFLATVEEYNPATDTWTTKASMPTPRYYLGVAAASNGKIYAIGGVAATVGGVATVEEYDPVADTWATKASMPTPRYNLGVAAASNGKIYAMGGVVENGNVLATVEEYDPSTNTWTTNASMPTARYVLGVVAASNGKIYAIGGGDGSGALATVEEYDPSTNTWTTNASMHTPRAALGVAAASNGKIYAMGGVENGNILATVEEYTPPDWGKVKVTDNPQWLDATHYRTSYDFTSLIPRGTYSVSTQDARGLDGLAVPPYQGADFVVDYAGYISVTTPPNTPVVSAWGDGSLTTLLARWTATDAHAAITGYRYAIGTTPGGVDVVNWTNVAGTSLTRSGLSLTFGRMYYVSIKARNEGGLWSLAGSSNGVIAGVVAAPTLASISPTEVLAGSGAFTLTANGSNFNPASVIRWKGVDLVTTFVTSAQLTAPVAASLLGTGGSVNVTVFNPGGGTTLAKTFTINNPAPTGTGLSPDHVTAGAAGFALTVDGTGFVSTSVIRWGTTALTTSFVSSTHLTASIDAAKVATAGSVSVTVFTPTPGGGTTSALAFTINNPAPAATGLSPDHVTAGATGFTLTVNGSGFVPTSVIRWGSTDLATTFVSSTQLTASIDASKVATPGIVNVTVFNPTAGGGTTSALTFTINNPTPVTIGLSPDHVTAGAAGFTLTVNGSGFVSTSVIRWGSTNLATAFVSGTQLTASIDASKVATAGTVNVTVFTPTPGGGTTSALTFSINNPTPAATGLSPDHVTMGAAGFTLTVNGSGFVSTSVIRWNGADLITTYVSSTQLTASIAASKIVTTGTVSVTVFTSTPGGGTTSALTFSINNPTPAASGLSPNHVMVGAAGFTLTVNGSGFVSTSVIRWGSTNLATAFVSGTQLTASIDASKVATAGTVNVTVFTPTPGGGTSSAQTFTISNNNPVPVLTGLDRVKVKVQSPGFTLTVNGTGFVNGSVVRWKGADLVTTFVNGTQLTAVVDASRLTSIGKVNITIYTAGPGGGLSSSLELEIEALKQFIPIIHK